MSPDRATQARLNDRHANMRCASPKAGRRGVSGRSSANLDKATRREKPLQTKCACTEAEIARAIIQTETLGETILELCTAQVHSASSIARFAAQTRVALQSNPAQPRGPALTQCGLRVASAHCPNKRNSP